MIELEEILFSKEGKRVDYIYCLSPRIKKYFKKEPFFTEYSVDVSAVPKEILTISFLANVMPIAWFAYFDVKVKGIDRNFYNSLIELKNEFASYYPKIMEGSSNLLFENIIDIPANNTISKNAMLFSGGLDAYATFMRHKEDLDLITIRGADIKLTDVKQWNELVEYNTTTEGISKNTKYYISSNFREFISYEVDKLLMGGGWWGKIQHGLALTTLVAPLSYLYKYDKLYIASSRSKDMPFSPWGSMPMTDNLIRWCSTQVIHDAYELSRFNKVKLVVQESKQEESKPPIRACYNEFKSTLNCNECEKCCRTIFGLMLMNENPNLYGFQADNTIYSIIMRKIDKGFQTHGTKLYWEEMINAYDNNSFFYFGNAANEQLEVEKIINTFNRVKEYSIGNTMNKNSMKLEIINRFPRIFNIYLKFRRKFIK